MVMECRSCEFMLCFFPAGSSGLFATSPEEGDLFSVKPASQKKPVRKKKEKKFPMFVNHTCS